jgi:hypothetical protein
MVLHSPTSSVPVVSRLRLFGFLGLLAFLWLGLAARVTAQQGDIQDIFGGLGTATQASGGDENAVMGPGEGALEGTVFDGDTGAPISGATVILRAKSSLDGGQAKQRLVVTDIGGGYSFGAVPGGYYQLDFVKSGYRASTLTQIEVTAGEIREADFPMPRTPNSPGDGVMQLDAFVVDVSTVDQMMAKLELRLDSDQLVNIMSAEDLSKFAATDVADALKRVAGVNIVEGQFAIIRGLEDRYSSTLFNRAPVPSPDPTSQSVQLDLFPSDVISNLVVAKTFDASFPGNSAAGSIDIVTNELPETAQLNLSFGSGFEGYAVDDFIGYVKGSPTGTNSSPRDVVETDFSGSFGGRREIFDREVRLKLVGAWETDYRTLRGYQEGRQPRRRNVPYDNVEKPLLIGDGLTQLPFQSGDLSYGLLGLSNGRWDLTQSQEVEQTTAFGGLGIDLDPAARHRMDLSIFYTKKRQETVQLKENGYIPGFDYDQLANQVIDDPEFEVNPDSFNNFATLGSWIARSFDFGGRPDLHEWYANVNESLSVSSERTLNLYQLNGSHEPEAVSGLSIEWAFNNAKTTQSENSLRSRITNAPPEIPTSFPVPAEGPLYRAMNDFLASSTEIEENQNFGRLDVQYEFSPSSDLEVAISGGGWFERAKRDVDASFLAFPQMNVVFCRQNRSICDAASGRGNAFGATLEEAGRNRALAEARLEDSSYFGDQDSTNEASREIWAVDLESTLTFWQDIDLTAGLRVETIEIRSDNDVPAFLPNGQPVVRSGAADIFPSRYLFFDRQDNRQIGEIPLRPGQFPVYNDQLLGLRVPFSPETAITNPTDCAPDGCVDISFDQASAFVNGLIDETFFLPTLGLAWRPTDVFTFRGAWSRTVARPSFREIGYYVTVPVGASGLEIGNPQLGLSEVESFDLRGEAIWGEWGDLVAFSLFYKTIENPIEQIVVRNPVNNDDNPLALFRTWFNNPNDAKLAGLEFEFQKNLAFLADLAPEGVSSKLAWLEYFSIGGNATYINATVRRTDGQRQRAGNFFGTLEARPDRRDDPQPPPYTGEPFPNNPAYCLPTLPDSSPGCRTDPKGKYKGLSKKRRLFGQPEWIANANVSFDQPDWGTQLTLALFAISDVLDAAGSAGTGVNGFIDSFTVDQYIDSFYQLDLVFRQEIWGGVAFQTSVKNLTNSTRGILYDEEATTESYSERRFRQGRDYSFALTYTQEF